MIFSILVATTLYYNVEYKQPDISYIRKPEKTETIIIDDNNHYTKQQRERIFKWCKSYSKKKVTDSDINYIIDEVYKTSKHPLLMLALISVESNFYKDAISKKGAQGLTQVMPLWIPVFNKKFKIHNRKDLRKISKNIKAGNYILTYYIKKEGNLPDALNKYVNGSKSYIRKVLRRWADITFYCKFGNFYTNESSSK